MRLCLHIGKYNVQIRAFTADDKDLLCENLHASQSFLLPYLSFFSFDLES